LTNGDTADTRTFIQTEFSAEQRHRHLTLLSAGTVIRLSPECCLRVLSPDSLQRALYETENQRSLVLKLDCGKTSVLLTADIDSVVEAQLIPMGSILRSDLLKVGHHGSKASSCREFLSAVSPSIAVISYGKHNRYGHPAKAVEDRLTAIGTHIHRTAREGTLQFVTNGSTWSFVESRAQRLIRLWKLPHA
jgi:competence protein ComEC